MPNHIHGIIEIDNAMVQTPKLDIPRQMIDSQFPVETPKLDVSTKCYAGQKSQWKPGIIGVIINQYKRICTIQSRKINPVFAWEPRFHDHIIRNNDELTRIGKYIIENPMNWNKDDLKI